MVHSYREICDFIDRKLSEASRFGSIQDCLNDSSYFHLSFDDGFVEHLQLAELIKDKYVIPYNGMSFSITIGNSLHKVYSGMDVVYQLLTKGLGHELINYLGIDNGIIDIHEIKQRMAVLAPLELKSLFNTFESVLLGLEREFLNESQLRKLSESFQINSHGVSHRFLTFNTTDSLQEMKYSKCLLEKITGQEIDTFCYPEGKNDSYLNNACQTLGYKTALSIRHESGNDYCIGRKVI